jgi:GxxExxY protein
MGVDDELTRRIIGCAYSVHNELGAGFLEKVYENALRLELEADGLRVRQQAPLAVRYRDQVVGEYFADLLVEDCVICELKAVDSLTKTHETQLVNYLAATGFDTGLLINFAKSVAVRKKFRVFRKTSNPVNPEKSC